MFQYNNWINRDHGTTLEMHETNALDYCFLSLDTMVPPKEIAHIDLRLVRPLPGGKKQIACGKLLPPIGQDSNKNQLEKIGS